MSNPLPTHRSLFSRHAVGLYGSEESTAARTLAACIGWRRDFALYLVNEKNLTLMTAYSYENNLRRVEGFTGVPAHKLTARDVRRFVREADLHPSTKSGAVVAVKAFHRWGALEELWETDMRILALEGPKQIRNPQPALTVEQVGRVLELAGRPNELRLVYLGLFAGLRVSESASITEKEWLPDRLRFTGKGRKVRDVPVHPQLALAREPILSNDTTADTLKSTCRSLSYVSRIPFSSHALRRTFSQTLVDLGVERAVVGALLGHAPASVTVQAYAPITWREMTAAISVLEY